MKNCIATYQSSLGFITIEHSEMLLLRLQISEREPANFGQRDQFSDDLFRQVEEYIRGERGEFDVQINLKGCTQFQRSVLKELRTIPYGERRSYREIAVAVGNPKAARAVGAACNKNPIHIIIPCHRVVATSGALTGYAAGLGVKEALLEIEHQKEGD